jgi:hypothetical protein
MAGWDEDQVLEQFHVPKPLRVAALFAVGYPGKLEDLHPEVQKKEQAKPSRRPPEEIFFWDDFVQKGKA